MFDGKKQPCTAYTPVPHLNHLPTCFKGHSWDEYKTDEKILGKPLPAHSVISYSTIALSSRQNAQKSTNMNVRFQKFSAWRAPDSIRGKNLGAPSRSHRKPMALPLVLFLWNSAVQIKTGCTARATTQNLESTNSPALRLPKLSLTSSKRQLKTHRSLPALVCRLQLCLVLYIPSYGAVVRLTLRVRRRLQLDTIDSSWAIMFVGLEIKGKDDQNCYVPCCVYESCTLQW